MDKSQTTRPDNTSERSMLIVDINWRDKISQILVNNNLRTDQVAIGQLMNLLTKAFDEGRQFCNDNR